MIRFGYLGSFGKLKGRMCLIHGHGHGGMYQRPVVGDSGEGGEVGPFTFNS